MEPIEIIKHPVAYVSGYENIPQQAQKRAKQLCWEYNRTSPAEEEKRRVILQQLLGTCSPMTGIEPDFHCDYGFNIHTHGLAVIGAGSVVTHDIPARMIAAGVPCKVLRPSRKKTKSTGEDRILRCKNAHPCQLQTDKR